MIPMQTERWEIDIYSSLRMGPFVRYEFIGSEEIDQKISILDLYLSLRKKYPKIGEVEYSNNPFSLKKQSFSGEIEKFEDSVRGDEMNSKFREQSLQTPLNKSGLYDGAILSIKQPTPMFYQD